MNKPSVYKRRAADINHTYIKTRMADARQLADIFDPKPSGYDKMTPFTPAPSTMFMITEDKGPTPKYNPYTDPDKRINNFNLQKNMDPFNIKALFDINFLDNKMPIKELLVDNAGFAGGQYLLDKSVDMRLQLAYAIADFAFLTFGRDGLESMVVALVGAKKSKDSGEINQLLVVKLLVEVLSVTALTSLLQMLTGSKQDYMNIAKFVGIAYLVDYGYEMIMAGKDQ